MMRSLPIILVACAKLVSAQDDFATLRVEYEQQVVPLIESRCLGCHDSDSKKGELDLERFANLDDVRSDPMIWQGVVEQVESGEMPPKDKKQLTIDERARLLAWATRYLDAEALSSAGDPGPVVLRRLSNAEYTYTVRDLTAISTLDPVREFPVDSAAGEGFTNTGDALAERSRVMRCCFRMGFGSLRRTHAVIGRMQSLIRFVPFIRKPCNRMASISVTEKEKRSTVLSRWMSARVD